MTLHLNRLRREIDVRSEAAAGSGGRGEGAVNVGVLSDIHANALALDQALALVDKDPAPIVILGDLLTYGPDPRIVLERLASRRDQVRHWLLGNHDELYLDLLRGREAAMRAQAPDWMRASIDWTLSQIDDLASWFCGLPFAREVVDGGILLAHANPFGDWRYLDSDEACHEAARALARRGLSVGVFGHTHCERFFTEPPRTIESGSAGRPQTLRASLVAYFAT